MGVLLVYGIINGALVGGQKLWHRRDQLKLDQMKAALADERTRIGQLESSLKTYAPQYNACETLLKEYSRIRDQHNAEIETLDAQHRRLSHLESRARGCMSAQNNCAAQYINYSDAVSTYNSRVSRSNNY
jgi:chromosome segregation ATPase